MNREGYLIFPFPQELLKAMRAHICKFMGVQPTDPEALEKLTAKSLLCGDEEFTQKYSKAFRMFPDSVAHLAERWVAGLAKQLGGQRAGINYVSEDEKRKNSALRSDSLDVFWRCVRPGKPDVGAPHCDYQFWEIVKGTPHDVPVPFDYDERWKIWVPLMGCERSNSLEIVPASHTQEIPIDRILTKNGYKPDIKRHWLEAHEKFFTCPLTTFRNYCILFHDKLVHRGPPNKTKNLRLSGELTILLKL
jgi:hypothetical protein